MEIVAPILGVILLVAVTLKIIYDLNDYGPVIPGYLDEFEMQRLMDEYEPDPRSLEQRIKDAQNKTG